MIPLKNQHRLTKVIHYSNSIYSHDQPIYYCVNSMVITGISYARIIEGTVLHISYIYCQYVYNTSDRLYTTEV